MLRLIFLFAEEKEVIEWDVTVWRSKGCLRNDKFVVSIKIDFKVDEKYWKFLEKLEKNLNGENVEIWGEVEFFWWICWIMWKKYSFF